MTELKTKINDASVTDFLNSIQNEQTRQDCQAIADLMQKATHATPKIWGSNIVGFGTYHYKYASGREADWMRIAFSPRKQNITLYITSGFEEYQELLEQLGKHSCGKSCLYIKRLSDVDIPTLEKLIQASVKYMNQKYPPDPQ
jgi:Domain of unknown function (DU1801)